MIAGMGQYFNNYSSIKPKTLTEKDIFHGQLGQD